MKRSLRIIGTFILILLIFWLGYTTGGRVAGSGGDDGDSGNRGSGHRGGMGRMGGLGGARKIASPLRRGKKPARNQPGKNESDASGAAGNGNVEIAAGSGGESLTSEAANRSDEGYGDSSPDGSSAVAVRVMSPPSRDFAREYEVSGIVEPYLTVRVRTRAGGIVESIEAEEGDRVRVGQVLARIEARREELTVERARVNLAMAKNSLAKIEVRPRDEEVELRKLKTDQAAIKVRQSADTLDTNKELFREKLLIKDKLEASESEHEFLKSTLATAKKELEVFTLPPRDIDIEAAKLAISQREVELREATFSLEERIVRAPLDGVVTERIVSLYDTVSANNEAFVICDLSKFKVVAKVPCLDAGEFRTGQECRIDLGQSEPGTGGARNGSVEMISPVVDRDTGTVKVEMVFTGDSVTLKPGLFAKIKVVTGTHRGVPAVPKSAVVHFEDSPHLFVMSGESGVDMQSVTLGYSDSEWTEIAHGLSPESLVVVAGQNLIDESSTVRIMTSEAAPRKYQARKRKRSGNRFHR